jgi:hypothetical protein
MILTRSNCPAFANESSRGCQSDDRVVATTRNPKAAEAHHQPSTRLGDSHNRPRLVGLRIQTNHRD